MTKIKIMTNIGIDTGVEIIKLGEIYAYLYKGRLCVGEAVKNPTKQSAYYWAMKNVYTGRIEYPYQVDVVVPNTEFKEIMVKIDYK